MFAHQLELAFLHNSKKRTYRLSRAKRAQTNVRLLELFSGSALTQLFLDTGGWCTEGGSTFLGLGNDGIGGKYIFGYFQE